MVQMLEYYENAQPPFTEDEKKAMDELRDLFALNPKINFQTDDYFLTKFLRVYDWNAQAAYDAIVFLYELKRDYPMLYPNKNISEYIELFNLNSRALLDKRDKNGRIVMVGILANIGNTHFYDAAMMDDIWAEIMLCDPLTQINGISIIADCKNLNSSILKWIIPKNCKVGAAKLEAFPVKEWTIHLVNMGSILKMCTMLIKPFLKKSTVAKFKFHHNGFSELHDCLGKECLPEEYGGDNGPIDFEKSIKFALAHEKLLERNRQFGFKTINA